jgi:hypothetical protein
VAAATDTVQTDAGPVRGTVTDEYRLFQGVPYAASTGGGRRWRPPRPVAPGGGGIGPVDYAAEHQLGFWEAAGPSPGLG